jgi:hypothetical protein
MWQDATIGTVRQGGSSRLAVPVLSYTQRSHPNFRITFVLVISKNLSPLRPPRGWALHRENKKIISLFLYEAKRLGELGGKKALWLDPTRNSKLDSRRLFYILGFK